MNQPSTNQSELQQRSEIRPIWGGFMGLGEPWDHRSDVVPSHPALAPQAMPKPVQHPPRVGTLESSMPETALHHHSSVLLGLKSRSVATFVGFAAVGAFVLVVFLGSMIGISPEAASATNQPMPLAQMPVPTADQDVTWSGGPAQTSLSVGEYGEQVAIATLTASLHEVSNTSVTFYADPERSGNALQQFAEVFGEAIATGRNPLRPNENRAGKESGR